MKSFLLTVLLFTSLAANAAVYQEIEDFIKEAFPTEQPAPQTLWMKKELRPQVEKILGHPPRFLRTRYWQSENRTLFVLEEIGKTEPITFGIIIKAGQIELIKVLEFRESRGWEVKHDFFSNQFLQAALTKNLELNKPIDGISGATLSVRAMTSVARMALLFDNYLNAETD